MPRVLVLLNRIPFPLDDGWKVRTFQLLRAVAHSAPTTIVCYGAGNQDSFLRALGGDVVLRLVPPQPRYTISQLLRGLFGPLPLYAYLEDSKAYRLAVADEVAHRADVVLCELTALFESLRQSGIDERIVIDTHNIDSIVFERYAKTQPTWPRRFYSRISAWKLRRYEAVAFARAGAVLVCSESEVEPVLARAPGARCVVVPNGAEVYYGESGPAVDPRRLFFFGRLDYHPNVDAIQYFLQEIFPRILARRPDAQFHVAGAGDDGTVADMLAAAPGTTYHGRLHDLRSVLLQAAVVVVPLRSGGGTRLKILEALAACRPVVSTALGAEGLALTDNVELRLADSPAAFADAVTFLMDHPAEGDRLARGGRQAVEAKYGWTAIGAAFVQVLRDVARGERPRPAKG